jgi:hypothetical protein
MSWSKEAAKNAMGVLNEFVERGDPEPIVSMEVMAERIEKAFQDRQTWNQTVMESDLAGIVKIYLVVPE